MSEYGDGSASAREEADFCLLGLRESCCVFRLAARMNYCVRPIEDSQYPWGLYEGKDLIGRFKENYVAMQIMKTLSGGEK